MKSKKKAPPSKTEDGAPKFSFGFIVRVPRPNKVKGEVGHDILCVYKDDKAGLKPGLYVTAGDP